MTTILIFVIAGIVVITACGFFGRRSGGDLGEWAVGGRRLGVATTWLLQAVERFSRHRLEPIRFIGGGARSDVWCQIFADVLGRAIEQVADPVNANARGAGLLAAVALGELTFSQVPERVKVAGTYQPEPATRELYGELFTEFVGFYRRNRRAHTRLNHRAG